MGFDVAYSYLRVFRKKKAQNSSAAAKEENAADIAEKMSDNITEMCNVIESAFRPEF